MLLSLLPVSVFAAEAKTTATWTKVELADITASDTIAITMTKDDATWVLPTKGEGGSKQPLAVVGTVADGKLSTNGDAENYGWTISVVEGGYQIKTGQNYLYLTAANNGMRIGDTAMVWSVADGYLTAKDSKDDSRYVGVYNGTDWRCYKNTTGNIAGQALAFYKLEATGGSGETEQVATPTGTDSGDIKVGSTVSFDCATEGAKLQYKVGSGAYQDYTGPVTITTSCTITVKAIKDGMTDSEEVSFDYKAYNVVEKYVRTLATDLVGDEQVLIYNPDSGMIMTTEYKSYTTSSGTTKAQLGSAAATLSGNALTTEATNAVFTFHRDATDANKIYFTADGKYLYMDTTDLKLVLANNSKNTLFQLEETEGGYFIKADDAKYDGKAQYLEYYRNVFTVFGMGSNTAIYTFQFFKATPVREYVDASEPEPTPEPETVAIATALAGATGTEFTVKGVVTLVDGQNYYLQDATGGICLRLTSKATDIALGDTIIGTGKRADYNGLPQLGSGTYEKSSGLKLAAKTTTISALTTADIGTYVKITGLEITKIDDNGGTYSNPNITLKDADGKTIQVYKAVVDKTDGAWAFKVGDKVDVTAAVSIFAKNGSTTLQLRNTVAGEIVAASAIKDPISDDMIPAGVMTVKDAGAVTAKTADVSVIGQVVYHYGKNYNGNASIDSIILEDVIDGEIYGFQIYDYTNYAKYKVGDVVKVTGTIELYNNLPQMKTPAMEVVKAGVEPIPAQEITVSQMGKDFLSEYVYIKDVTLGTYNGGSNTVITDATGNVNLFKGVPLPTGVTEADVTAVYGCCSVFKTTYQLRNGSSGDYVTNVTPPVTGGLPKEGDKVVIYSAAAQAALAAENDTKSIEKSSTTVIEDGKLTKGNGAAVFTVEKNGEYLRFKNATYGYLCSNGTGNNAFYSKDFSEDGVTTDDADWLVRECSGGVGGFEMESRVAKYSGHSQWLEYYSDSFKTYSMYSKDGKLDYTIYSFSFYPVADGVRVNDGIVNDPSVLFDSSLNAYLGQDYTLPFSVDAPFGVKTISAKLGESDTLTVTKGEGLNYTVTVPKDKVVGDKLTITVSGTDEKDVSFKGSVEITVVDEPSIVDVFPAANTQTLNDKRPAIGATLVNVHENPTITMLVQGVEVTHVYDAATGKVTYTPAQDMADGKVVVSLTVKRDDNKEVTKTWSFTVGKAEFTAYFGQLHGHTQYSDGAGSLMDALDYIANLPESANVQFVAFTDHSNYFDTTSAANPEGALYDMSLASSYSQQRWKEYKDAIANFNATQSGIIAIGGFEMTWSGGPGHINTFNTPGIVSRNNSTLNNKTSDAGMKAYYALLSQTEGADSISQFNHPGTTFGNFSDFSYWDPVIDSRMYMVEVGNGEGQIGAGGYYPSYEQYIMALDKGWHVAPTNNQDNHKGKWGNANDARDVILTDNFTEEGIYQAIRDMHMYATEDKNLLVNYSVNGQIMGSSITDVPETLDINVSVNDPDATDSIAKVEVVVNSGKVAHTWSDAAELASGELSVTLDSGYSYYFIRVTEADGDLAVTAPVWVGETLKLGISNLVCGTSTPVTGEALTLTTTLFNSETSDATVKSLTYTINGSEVIGADTTGYTVAASSTKDVTFQWTPTDARSVTIKVTAVVEQNGKEYTFTKDITLDVLNADDLVYIGIDAAHYNEYVAGNYKDSMGNFGELAASYNVRTVQLNTSADLIAACSNPKYKALILTAPSRRLAAAQSDPKTYSAEELAAITAFNANGGTVILAGWSDNYENYDVIRNNPAIKHMAATQNEVLAALGSSLRISDDATYDDVRSAADGVDKWRLYFSSYNMDNPLTSGVIFDAENPYDKLYTERFSHYGGASIYAVDASGNATSTLPATVSPVVYGHASTYSVDVDGDGLGGNNVPKYAYTDGTNRLMVMASEQLAGKGLIIVSGAAFMSNFEVQATLDSGAEKNYSNYRICENLLNLINPVKISTVAAVQAEKDEGVKFTIEAIVTSNASGYDKNTAFFDCIYAQDDTAGINCFPVAGNFKIGDKVRITGTTSSYQGERQLAVTSIEKIADATAPTPKEVTAAQVNDGSVLGSLIRVKGVITKVEMANGLVQTIMVRDANGNECRVFIDGYITTSEDVKNAEVGREIDVVGLASYDNTFTLADGTPIAPRIRIRDRADVKCGDMVEPGTCQHPSSSWKTVKSATCTATGTENLVCNRCGTILDTRTTAKLAHVDKNHDNKCDVCGKNLSTTVPSVTPSTPVKSGNTADNSNMGLWVVLMSLSLFGSVTLLRSKKRRA